VPVATSVSNGYNSIRLTRELGLSIIALQLEPDLISFVPYPTRATAEAQKHQAEAFTSAARESGRPFR
jgi:hypothetical protein